MNGTTMIWLQYLIKTNYNSLFVVERSFFNEIGTV